MRDIAIKKLNNFFKNQGFKKKDLIWYYSTHKIYLLCEYQGSRISKGFFLNFGFCFIDLLDKKVPPIPKSNDWHFVGRYNQLLTGIIESPQHKFSLECTESDLLEDLADMERNITGIILPYLKNMLEPNYFLNNFPDKFDHDKLWIQNIREIELVNYLKL